MRKVVWISLASFLLGILLAGYIFVYLPEKRAPRGASSTIRRRPSAPTCMRISPRTSPTSIFVKVSDKVGPTVVKIECEKVERQSMPNMPGGGPGDDFWDRSSAARASVPSRRKSPSRDGLLHQRRRLHHHQQPHRRERPEGQGLYRPGRRIRGQDHRLGSADRRGPGQGRGEGHAVRRAGRFLQSGR